jgi:hypothetical protein
MTAAAFLRWLLDLIRQAPDPLGLPLAADAGAGDAIEVTIRGRTFRILVEAVG